MTGRIDTTCTPIFYKWIAGVFGSLLVVGVIGVFNTNMNLIRIDQRLANLESQWGDRFTGTEGEFLTQKVDNIKTFIQSYVDRHIEDHKEFQKVIEKIIERNNKR